MRENQEYSEDGYSYILEYGSELINTSALVICRNNTTTYIISPREFQAYNYGVEYEEIDTYLYSVGGYEIEPH